MDVLTIADCELDLHAADIARIDMSFSTNRSYSARSSDSGMNIALEELAEPLEKRFEIALNDSSWTHAYVALEMDQIRGVVAIAIEEWNRRLVVRHVYVDRPHRCRGIGRQLMECAINYGRRNGALTAWVETSNLNYPGVEAYRRMGFSICGADTSLYAGTPARSEFAIFLARPI